MIGWRKLARSIRPGQIQLFESLWIKHLWELTMFWRLGIKPSIQHYLQWKDLVFKRLIQAAMCNDATLTSLVNLLSLGTLFRWSHSKLLRTPTLCGFSFVLKNEHWAIETTRQIFVNMARSFCLGSRTVRTGKISGEKFNAHATHVELAQCRGPPLQVIWRIYCWWTRTKSLWTDPPKLPKLLGRLQFPSSQVLSLFASSHWSYRAGPQHDQSHGFKGGCSMYTSVLFFRTSPAGSLRAIQKPIKLDAFDSFPAKCPFGCRRTHISKCQKKTSSVSSFWKCHLTEDRPTWVFDFISKKLMEKWQPS